MSIFSEQSEQIDQIATALALVQGELKDADRDTQGHGYDYADLSQVLAIIRPIAAKHGISFVQPIMDSPNGKVVIETKLMHKSGQWMRSSFSLNAVENKKMSGAQAVGAACTYGRRYALAATFGITQQDTDASNKLIEDVLNEFQLARIMGDEQKAIDMIERLPDSWKAELREKLTRVESQWLVDIQKKREPQPEPLTKAEPEKEVDQVRADDEPVLYDPESYAWDENQDEAPIDDLPQDFHD